MISVGAVLAILIFHFLADFVLQTDTMARNKSKSNFWLWLHVTIYSISLWPLCIPLGFWNGLLFIFLNFCGHFATDYVSSRMTSRLRQKERWHMFFVVIGADQAIHLSTLVLTYWWLR